MRNAVTLPHQRCVGRSSPCDRMVCDHRCSPPKRATAAFASAFTRNVVGQITTYAAPRDAGCTQRRPRIWNEDSRMSLVPWRRWECRKHGARPSSIFT